MSNNETEIPETESNQDSNEKLSKVKCCVSQGDDVNDDDNVELWLFYKTERSEHPKC